MPAPLQPEPWILLHPQPLLQKAAARWGPSAEKDVPMGSSSSFSSSNCAISEEEVRVDLPWLEAIEALGCPRACPSALGEPRRECTAAIPESSSSKCE